MCCLPLKIVSQLAIPSNIPNWLKRTVVTKDQATSKIEGLLSAGEHTLVLRALGLILIWCLALGGGR